jgi:glutaredoxin
MSRTCPNCGHRRQTADTAPEWQCPACEKAYNKGAGAAVDGAYGRYAPPPAPPRRQGFGLFKGLLVCAVLGGAVWAVRPVLQEKTFAAASARRGEQPDVLLYATEWCGYCAATRSFFAAQGIRYTELDIEKSSVGRDGYRQLGGRGVPLIVIGEDVVHGYDESRLRALLKPWMNAS